MNSLLVSNPVTNPNILTTMMKTKEERMKKIKYLVNHTADVKPLTTVKSVEETKDGIKVTMETTADFTVEDYVKGMANIYKALSD